MAKKKRKRRIIPAQTPRPFDGRHMLRHVELIRDALDGFPRKPEPKPVAIRPRPPRPRPDFRPVEDLRHETQKQTFRTRSGRVVRTETRPQGDVRKSRLHTPLHTYFQDAKRVLVCIRREARKRVLFALQRAGSGKRVSRIHRFTEKSHIRCK